MKYKKHIATGVLAFSLLVGGSVVFAATPQDLGIKNIQQTFQKQHKGIKNVKGGKKDNNIIGTVSAVDSTGFTIDVTNIKVKTVLSVEVKTDALTVYTKDGIVSSASDLAVGQKVIISGSFDKVTNIMIAKEVKIVTKFMPINGVKKENKKVGLKIDEKLDTNATLKKVQ